MNQFTLSASGIVVAVAGTLLMHFGFSDVCSNQIVTLLPVLLGSAMTWIGNVRNGAHTVGGFAAK